MMALVAASLIALATSSSLPAQTIPTTQGSIALANLDSLIAQRGDAPGSDELWLLRSRFLADYDALERAAALADLPADDRAQLLRRARIRAALHRFDEALADLDAATTEPAQQLLLRASILTAQGRSERVIPALERLVAEQPSYAAWGALAAAYSDAQRFTAADQAFARALGSLDTTSPFPYAYIWFARGTMWAESAHDRERGAHDLERALDYLPEFVGANLHLAEIEVARGDETRALERLDRIAGSREPEVLALRGRLRAGHGLAGDEDIAAARARFEELLARQPLAFADHAAEFYLGAGADAGRALTLAKLNCANRDTPRARDLLTRAAAVTSRSDR
jgi:tetratricopeptide (TPR) repeat protein